MELSITAEEARDMFVLPEEIAVKLAEPIVSLIREEALYKSHVTVLLSEGGVFDFEDELPLEKIEVDNEAEWNKTLDCYDYCSYAEKEQITDNVFRLFKKAGFEVEELNHAKMIKW